MRYALYRLSVQCLMIISSGCNIFYRNAIFLLYTNRINILHVLSSDDVPKKHISPWIYSNKQTVLIFYLCVIIDLTALISFAISHINIVKFSYNVRIKSLNNIIPIHLGNLSFYFRISYWSFDMFYLFMGGGLGNLPYKDKSTKSIIFIKELSPAHKAKLLYIFNEVVFYIIRSIHF